MKRFAMNFMVYGLAMMGYWTLAGSDLRIGVIARNTMLAGAARSESAA